MSSVDEATTFVTTKGLEVAEVPDGFVIYDEPNEKVHYLNPTAAVIYTLCDGKMPVSDVRSLIREAYDLEEDIDLDEFFTDLEKAGLICRAG
ncbi:PqqD family protein [Anderseniella sp. Alg231-50]|uniref:PqqD family protein n=1 Tax=Anderseniella sp. Alg231-50 TaxID=1922226 RepID=UPI00307B5397